MGRRISICKVTESVCKTLVGNFWMDNAIIEFLVKIIVEDRVGIILYNDLIMNGRVFSWVTYKPRN